MAGTPRSRSERAPGIAPDRKRMVGLLLAGAILAAPFLALLYGRVAGLAVSTVALATTAFLAAEAARGADTVSRRRLGAAAAFNLLLAALCAAALVALVA